MIMVTVYTRKQCPECDQVLEDLKSLEAAIPHQLVVIDVENDPLVKEKIGENLPVVEVGPYRLHPPIKRQDLQIMLGAARDRIEQLQKVDNEGYQKRVERGRKITTSDRITDWLSRHYLALVNVLLLVYTALPFLAPVLMKSNIVLPARIIYKAYSPMCHQLAFRSWFLFGQQAYYPRELVGASDLVTFEELQNTDEIDLLAARDFVGNEVVGYKVALCERDIAIYGFMLLFGLAFWIFRRRFRTIPWYAWVIVGLIPIGLDGVSQLPSFWQGMPGWIPMRESTPLLRTLTGGLFGWMTAWYLFPMLEETARETRRIVQRKMAVIHQTGPVEKA